MDVGFQPQISQSWQNQIESLTSMMQPVGVNLVQELSKMFDAMGDLFKNLGSLTEMLNGKPPMSAEPAPIRPPSPEWGSHPTGSLLKSDDGTITTPGGYKIQQEGQFNWNITGPDGKSTRVWGDPHVQESDGGKWDFQRDASFNLPDGTRINVNVGPYGPNPDMSVTQSLEVISGNDRVQVSDIDKGKGQVGDITHDGRLASLREAISDKIDGDRDTFVMGKETDDWSFLGREIQGGAIDKDGTSKLTLGKELEPIIDKTKEYGGGQDWASGVYDFLKGALSNLEPPRNPLQDFMSGFFGGLSKSFDVGQPQTGEALGHAFNAIGSAFDFVSEMLSMSDALSRRLVM